MLGLNESDIMDCVAWMRPFAHVLEQQQRVELKKFPQVTIDNSHNIQTHVVSLELLVCCHCQLVRYFLFIYCNIIILKNQIYQVKKIFYEFINIDMYAAIILEAVVNFKDVKMSPIAIATSILQAIFQDK